MRGGINDAPMENNFDILQRLRSEWSYTGVSQRSTRHYEYFAAQHDTLALSGCSNFADVVRALEPRGGRSVEQRAHIITALLADAREPFIARTLLQTMLPGVVSVCRQLRFGEGIVSESGEAMGICVALLSELIYDWAGQQRIYAAPDLLSALRGRFRRWLLKEKQHHPYGDLDGVAKNFAATENSELLTRLENFRTTEQARMASLVYRRVFEGCSLQELALAEQCSAQSLNRELRWFTTHYLL